MPSIDDLICNALQEDIGSGDITTDSLVGRDVLGKGIIVAKENIILAGLDLVCKVFRVLDPNVTVSTQYLDGDQVRKSETILEVFGTLRALLKGERTALNFLQRLSGIATKTKSYIRKVKGTKIKLVDTRKTIPCWRILEKYAVRVGGGYNHRMGLYDGVLIKDNHIAVCGGIREAVNKLRGRISHLMKIEVEVSSLEEVQEAISANVDIIMLDNMEINEIRRAVELIGGRTLVEVSGGVTLSQLSELLLTGVDLISIGALTHSSNAVDLSMKINPDFHNG